MTNLEEKWLPITNYEGLYEVSNHGRIKSCNRIRIGKNRHGCTSASMVGKIMSCENGRYPKVSLYNKGIDKMFSVHRLVAIEFISNPLDKPHVNHINGIKTDNRAENLEWCTTNENVAHAFRTGLIPMEKIGRHRKGVSPASSREVLHLETGIYFDNMQDACTAFNIRSGYLSNVLNGYIKDKPGKAKKFLILK